MFFLLLQEAAIEEYFKPLDKEAEALMKIQLEGEENRMKQMLKVMQNQALLEKAEADKVAIMHSNLEVTNQYNLDSSSTHLTKDQMR